jgi:heme exporter protein C
VLALLAAVLVGLAVAVAFFVAPEDADQGFSQKIFYFHVPIALTAYAAFGWGALKALLLLWRGDERYDLESYVAVHQGTIFGALTLLTGSIWGRPVWGVWWAWDARLVTTLVLLFLYVGYLALRRVPADDDTRARRAAVTALLAVLVVPVNHFAVEWWRTLHQGRSLSQLDPGRDLDGIFIGAMFLGFLAMTLAYAWFVLTRLRTLRLEAELGDEALDVALAERRAEAVEALTP